MVVESMSMLCNSCMFELSNRRALNQQLQSAVQKGQIARVNKSNPCKNLGGGVTLYKETKKRDRERRELLNPSSIGKSGGKVCETEQAQSSMDMVMVKDGLLNLQLCNLSTLTLKHVLVLDEADEFQCVC